MSWSGRIGITFVLVLSGAVFVAAEEVARSIYVPVVFHVADEIDGLRMWVVGEEDVVADPAALDGRTFVFTYYPDSRKTLPSVIEVRFESARACGRRPFKASLLITPARIVSNHGYLPFNRRRMETDSQYQQDVRVSRKKVRIQCQHAPFTQK